MKVTVKTAFIDRETKELYRVGRSVEIDDLKRVRKLAELGLIEDVTVETEEKPKPKKAPAKKRK